MELLGMKKRSYIGICMQSFPQINLPPKLKSTCCSFLPGLCASLGNKKYTCTCDQYPHENHKEIKLVAPVVLLVSVLLENWAQGWSLILFLMLLFFFPCSSSILFSISKKGTFYKVFLWFVSQGKAHLFNKLYQVHWSVFRTKMISWHVHEIKIKVFKTRAIWEAERKM